jgi:putative GTP pyrophosphokinase
MKDVLGGRIVVYFVSQLSLIDSEIRNSDTFELSSRFPPVAYLDRELHERFELTHLRRLHKDSGYASVHYYVRLRNSILPRKDRPWIELQVRTLAEDIWACVEHIIGYKPHKRTSFPVTKQFQILSRQLAAIDEHFNFLFEELSRFQREGKFTGSDPLNPENLPQVVSEFGIRCAQSEIDGLLRLLNSRGLSKVAQLRKAGTRQRVQRILSIYISDKSRKPSNFEYVAHIANLGMKSLSKNEAERRIRTQIKFLDAWDRLRRGFA